MADHKSLIEYPLRIAISHKDAWEFDRATERLRDDLEAAKKRITELEAELKEKAENKRLLEEG